MTQPQYEGVLAALLDGARDEGEWQERALCAQTDPEAFFPEKGGSTWEAKRICQGCEVRSECLEYALAHDERGVWGGLSEQERRRLQLGQPITVERKPRSARGRREDVDLNARAASIAAMRARGVRNTEIAETLGISTRSVERSLKRAAGLLEDAA